ncbi:cell division cycle protein [Coccidioides immitis RS]|uniref:Cell division cycle protein n=2 Tax=Coccidioides immitis TaxID=5501 RepID=J3K857_COCIM|nr:cell division cycle protein [Coccidioides immitis RS]EAS30973.3 cell division cycle protein [Coccidioides immitis RS]KMP03569.1 anaphase-promoting complex subunit 8 [Coccidioides immitis RMSCC 2394]TPX23844.1 Anaphase-promoting complex subunit 23 [Coccidioides immitis]
MAANFTEDNIQELRYRLEDAARKCSERCLYQSAKWAAEMLDSLIPADEFSDGADTEPDSPMDISPSVAENPFLTNADPEEAALEAREAHKYILAKAYFDTREYDRCAAIFLPPSMSSIPLAPRPPTSTSKIRPNISSHKGKEKSISLGAHQARAASKNPFPKLSQKSLFLALYAKYLAGEKRKDEETEMVLGPADGGMTVNRELHALAQGLEGWFSDRRERGLESRGQGWLEYLYGVILLKAKNDEDAKKWLIRSVHLYPFHWGAWQELNDLLTNTDDLKRVAEKLPQNIMTLIFHLYSSQELYQATEATYHTLTELESIFPSSAFLKTQRALLYYHSKDFEEASHLFSELLISHPHRLDGLDHYSNILYVMGARPQLAFVAQMATATDKFRPETCCVVGNYYSLKSEHEKAVMYFRRALTLDRNFLSAWTLMGHEYIEMKNTHAAIESYRRAVDVNRKDYRAWYGLGQAYEVLDMAFYALFYYQRAAALRPYDPKMWQAVGSCYAKMGRADQSIRALKRALAAGSYYDSSSSTLNSFANSGAAGISFPPGGPGNTPFGRRILDPETLHQIATLYERLGDEEEAAAYMELTLQQETGQMGGNNDDEDNDDDAEDDAMSASRRTSAFTHHNDDMDEEPTGTGVTAATSKARLWLARWALRHNDLDRAEQLANELCQDGVEIEEAKALMRDVRARREGRG